MFHADIPTTVEDIRSRLRDASREELLVLEKALVADPRKGVQSALKSARRRLEVQEKEEKRLELLYTSEWGALEDIVGLDEVGRGPVAGPLSVGAVVLPSTPRIKGLNDSKQLSPAVRYELSREIKEIACAWSVVHIPPDEIDAKGISASLYKAFGKALQQVEEQYPQVKTILVDGNPLGLDLREVNLIKGDSRSASIAAASIIAKVERDALMDQWAQEYPVYGFDSHKGYASADHIAAIKEHGLSPIHRASFCRAWTQESLF